MTAMLTRNQKFLKGLAFLANFCANFKKTGRLGFGILTGLQQNKLMFSMLNWDGKSKSVEIFSIKHLCVFLVQRLLLSFKNMSLLKQFGRKISCWSTVVLFVKIIDEEAPISFPILFHTLVFLILTSLWVVFLVLLNFIYLHEIILISWYR